MNDQQQSRADALTDERRIMDEAANGPHLRPVAWAVYNGWSRICFYMTEEDARDHAQKAQKNHDLSGSLAAFRVVPLYAAPQPAQADAPAEAREPHSDDVSVDSFAAAMKHKLALARAKGRGGWETCSPADLSRMLREHVEKGDPRDVANFCMMLWHHGSPIVSAPADSGEARLTDEQIETLAHRRAYRYRHGPDSIEFIFNRHCLLNFARALLQGADHAR
ncbi:TPA: hypothetical protein U2Q23_004705 [Burkholderia multivorans]|nr:hypothetical protein [Burkholderia multivorans]HEM7871818.1 hypothetical protein [Burkholderia multivorans]HEM7907379.1 hypothetical protein [Burkholderia multivorans]HEM8538544.1 hypothetical protein [Burkholderia multivorans]